VTTLLHRFLAAADASPGRTCLIDGDRRVRYGVLAGNVRSVGARLQETIKAGDRVAVLADSSPEYVAAYYGAWWAGGVAVGLNTALRAGELRALIRDCGAACLVLGPGQQQATDLRGGMDEVAVLDVEDAMSAPGAGPDPPAADLGALACLMYTSGTTGHPKGVMLSHANLASNTDSICGYLSIGPDETALCCLPFFYSFGASILHSHLAQGATVIVERSFMYPRRVLERIAAERATSFAGVPSTYYLLLRRADLEAHDLSTLRYVTQAGGPMEARKIQEFRTRLPAVPFIVMYGQTEATARLAWLPPADLDRKPGSAGRAIPGVELSVRDDHGRPVPAGHRGEVWARGGNVMSGYWNDPEATARVLHEGWLRTGDVGTMDQDGYLFLQGRTREMIKSGAHRISPGQIEEAIRAVPGVEDVAVVGVPDELLGQAVRACVIAPSPSADLKREIQRHCLDTLPPFMVPKVVEFHELFPRTGSGKIRKHLL
jgi:acyl-CoA synthetase (AMP-forming)/AMP-acid ligase II